MNALAKEIAAICRMQIELVKINAATFFPGQPLPDVLDLHFVLLHLFLADAEGRHLSVSELARAMGLSRDTVRHKLAKLVEMGQCTNGDEGYALSHDRDMAVLLKVLVRKAETITAASKEVVDLAASKEVADSASGGFRQLT
jgi:DNA-binding transcriptional ArsR family regulator